MDENAKKSAPGHAKERFGLLDRRQKIFFMIVYGLLLLRALFALRFGFHFLAPVLLLQIGTLWMFRKASFWIAIASLVLEIIHVVLVFGGFSLILLFGWGWVAGDGGNPPPLSTIFFRLGLGFLLLAVFYAVQIVFFIRIRELFGASRKN